MVSDICKTKYPVYSLSILSLMYLAELHLYTTTYDAMKQIIVYSSQTLILNKIIEIHFYSHLTITTKFYILQSTNYVHKSEQ